MSNTARSRLAFPYAAMKIVVRRRPMRYRSVDVSTIVPQRKRVSTGAGTRTGRLNGVPSIGGCWSSRVGAGQINASIVIDLVDTKKKSKLASVSQPLADLAHQRTARLQLAMARSKEKSIQTGRLPAAVLYIKTRVPPRRTAASPNKRSTMCKRTNGRSRETLQI